jgi:hypothetical protein
MVNDGDKIMKIVEKINNIGGTKHDDLSDSESGSISDDG